MRYRRLVLVLLACVLVPAHAQDVADIEALNQAWASYNSALETSEVDSIIESSGEVLDVAARTFDSSDERMPLFMLNHGNALIQGKRFDEARIVLQRALKLSEDIHGKDSAQLVGILSSLAETHKEFEDRVKQRYYERAKKIQQRESGKDSEAYAALMIKAGTDIYSSGDISASKFYLQRAYEGFLKLAGPDDFRTGVAAFFLAKIEFGRQRYKQSTTHLLDALAAFQGEDDTSVRYQLHTRALLVRAYESQGKSDLATEHCVAIGRVSKLRADQDYDPLFRMAPRYPQAMLSKGSEGFVDLAFTVDESGIVRNVEVADLGPGDRGFKNVAIDAVERFRYAPRFEDGVAVSVDNVKTRITFELSH